MKSGWRQVLAILIICIVVSKGHTIADRLMVNIWIVNVVDQFLHDKDMLEIPSPPAKVLHEAFWQGRWALIRGDIDLAVSLLQSQAKIYPDDPMILGTLGEALLAQGNYSSGVQLLRRVGDYNLLWEVGRDAYQDGEWDKAILAISSAHELEPQNRVVTRTLFLTYYKGLQDVSAAIDFLGKEINTSTNDADKVLWMLELMRLYRDEERWQELKTICQEILVIQPNNGNAYASLAWAEYKLGGSVPEALLHMEMAARLAPDDGEIYLLLGEFYYSEKQYRQAAVLFRKAADLTPGSGWPLILLANAALAGNDVPFAILALSEGASKFPEDYYIQYRLADAYWRAGNADKAVSLINDLIGKGVVDIRYYILAGQAYETIGQQNRAILYYRQVLQIDPENKDAMAGLQRLNTVP